MAEDLRSAVEAAFNSVTDADPDAIELDTAATAAGHEDNPADEIDPAADDEGAALADDADAGDGVTPPTPTPDVDASADAPPASWSAAEKASWAKLPADLKAPILRREKEIREQVRVDGTAKKFVESINQTIKPYAAMLDKSGLNPVSVMQESLVLAQSLNSGTAQEKAETLGKMIMHFGVDIDALDKFLVDPKNAKPAANAQPQSPAYDPTADKRLSPLFTLASELEARNAEAAEKLIGEAKGWPGFEEARGEMADLNDWAVSQGKKMTLGQLYTRVTGLQPPVKAVVPGKRPNGAPNGDRPTPEALSKAAAALARGRKAASSVAGERRTPAAVNTDDLRSTVAAAAAGVL